MGASQAKQKIEKIPSNGGGSSNGQVAVSHTAQCDKKTPELRVSTETWTRESHGLYDFEGNEVNLKSFALKGTHTIARNDSTIYVKPIEV